MAYTGTGRQTDPWVVDNYADLKTFCAKSQDDYTSTNVYIKLKDNCIIDCNTMGDSWEWTTIPFSSSGGNTTLDLNGGTIKNALIAKNNKLFSFGANRTVVIRNSKNTGGIFNIFSNEANSVFYADYRNLATLEGISISMNTTSTQSYPIRNMMMRNCATYIVSSKLNTPIFWTDKQDGTAISNCDFYFDIKDMNNNRLFHSNNSTQHSGCRVQGTIAGSLDGYWLIEGNFYNSVINIDNTKTLNYGSKNMHYGASSGIVNKDICLVSSTSFYGNLIPVTSEEIVSYDALNSKGFPVVKVG